MMTKEEIIKHFKTILECEQFVVTGSYVLNELGLMSKTEDLDIILVKPSQGTIDILNKLIIEYPTKSKCEQGYDSIHMILFNDVKIDFFTEKEKVETLKLDNGIEISTLKRIFDAKKKMSRPKDWIQLLAISRKIVSEKEFNDYISKI